MFATVRDGRVARTLIVRVRGPLHGDPFSIFGRKSLSDQPLASDRRTPVRNWKIFLAVLLFRLLP